MLMSIMLRGTQTHRHLAIIQYNVGAKILPNRLQYIVILTNVPNACVDKSRKKI